MILHGIEYQRPTSLNMRILADHVTYSFLAFMKSIFHFCLGCYCGGYSQNGRSNLSSFHYPDHTTFLMLTPREVRHYFTGEGLVKYSLPLLWGLLCIQSSLLYIAVHFIHISHMKTSMAWKCFPHYWPFLWEIHWSPMDSPPKGPVTWALMFCLMLT